MSTQIIDKLTPQQEKDLQAFYEEMLEVGRTIQPINHEQCEAVITKLYARINRPAPKFFYFDSPMACVAFKEKCGDNTGLTGYFTGQQSICWKAFYKFAERIGVKYDEQTSQHLEEWFQESKALHWWFPFEHAVLICERPIRLSLNEKGQLHNESVKAIEYKDGYGFYYLNGIRVPESLVTTPAENLDIKFFQSEKNADIKAEFVRKYGVERMLNFGKKIDSYENYDAKQNPFWHASEYELWDMASLFPGLDYQPYLKMMNQTTKIWHVEALSPNCRTIKDALKERFGGREMEIADIA